MAQSLKNIKALVFDVDGIFTNGTLISTDQGEFLRIFDTRDGFGVRMASMKGLMLGIITGGDTPGVFKRLRVLGIPEDDIYLHSRCKIKALNDYCQRHSITPDQVLYAGDDLPDVPVLEAVGYSIAPADAVQEAKDAADQVSELYGGRGFVRSICEMVMKAQGLWEFSAEEYERIF